MQSTSLKLLWLSGLLVMKNFKASSDKVHLSKYWDKPWLVTLRESAMSPNGEDGLRRHSPSPRICAEKLLLKLLHHQGAGGQHSTCIALKDTSILFPRLLP